MHKKILVLIVVLLAYTPALAASSARVDIQYILTKSDVGHKAKAVIEEFRAGLEREKLSREKELGDLKEKNAPTFPTKLSEYKEFMGTAQANLQSINNKIINYLVESIVKKAVNTYGSTFDSICTFSAEDKKCFDVRRNEKIASINVLECKDITNDVLQSVNNDELLTDSIKFTSPYIPSGNNK